MTDIKGAILFYLETSGRYIKRPELLNHLHSMGHLISDRDMRMLIADMIESDGFCIEANEKGYSMITSSEQFVKAKKYLNKKSMALLMREYFLSRNWNRKTSPLISKFTN